MLIDDLRTIRETKISRMTNSKKIIELYEDIVHQLKIAASEGECQLQYVMQEKHDKLTISIIIQRLLEQKLKVHADHNYLYIYFGVMKD